MTGLAVGLVSPYDLARPGGVQAQVLGLARYLGAGADRPVVIGPGLPPGTPGIDLGGTVTVPGNRSRVPISLDPRVGSRLREAVSGLDVIHVHEPLMPLVSWFATSSPAPVVATFHADPPPWARGLYRLGSPLVRRLLQRCARVTAVSPVAASVVPAGVEVEVVPNGVDVAALASGRGKIHGRVAFLGRDEPRKGLDVLLRAWETVSVRRPEGELVVLGANRRHPGVTWMGRVEDPVKHAELASASLFVAPQLGGESFGIVLLEAMAAGCAVVASDLPAFRALAGEVARLFPPGDAEALARHLVDLLSEPGEVAAMGSRGRELAARYDWTVVGAAYRDIYRAVVP